MKTGTYITPAALQWALKQLIEIPKNQLALFFFLMLAKVPIVSSGQFGNPSSFENEFKRYLIGPIKGGGEAVFNPFAAEWRAAEYLNSTVYGRLLNGSHRWTEGTEAFFSRSPATGWPAKFSVNDSGFNNLRLRASPPCLKSAHRLPLSAVVIIYYRFMNLSEFSPVSLDDLVKKYKDEVLSCNPRLIELFVAGPNFLSNVLFRSNSLTENEKIACYPPSPYSGEPKKSVLIYEDDIDAIKAKLTPGEDIADFIKKLLRKGNIWKA
jgi:hypothetical protein